MTPETYSKVFKLRNGIDKALKIAERCYRDTSPEGWNNLPEGSVFHYKNRQGKLQRNDSELSANHLWWKHVYFILKKQSRK